MSQHAYLALDIGEVRIGVAVGSVMPFGRGTLRAENEAEVIATIRNIVINDAIVGIVVGLPKVKSGDASPSYKLALAWVERLKQAFPALPIHTVDEAYTSVAAEESLRKEGVSIQGQKEKIDERSAELILSQFFSERDA